MAPAVAPQKGLSKTTDRIYHDSVPHTSRSTGPSDKKQSTLKQYFTQLTLRGADFFTVSYSLTPGVQPV